MKNVVAIVLPSKLTECYDAKIFDKQTVNDISNELRLIDHVLFIHTPKYRQLLEADCEPTEEYKELIISSSVSRYSRPEYYLIELPKSDENKIFIKIVVKNQTKHVIPPFFASFDQEKLDLMVGADIKEKIKNDLCIELASYKVYFENEGEDSLSDSAHAHEVINKAKSCQLILDAVVTDKAAGKLSHRCYAVAEIVSTEESYVSDLKYIQNFWEANMRKRQMMPEDQLQIVFKDIYAIVGAQSFFLEKFKMRGTTYGACVAESFLEFSSVFKASQLYVSNYAMIIEVLNNFNKKPKFNKKMKELNSKTEGRDIFSYLITPVQRMPRYILFLRDLIKDTPPSHPDHELMQLAYDAIEKVTKQFDDVTALSKKQTELMRLQKQISKNFIFLDKQRELVTQFSVSIPINPPSKIYQGTIYIFNDLVLIVRTRKKGELGVKIVYDSEIGVFQYKYQWPDFNSITIDATKKPYGDRKSIYTLVFEKAADRDNLLKELENIRTRIKIESKSKFCFEWANIDVKSDMPALVKPLTATVDADPYIFSNNLVYKLINSEITKVGQLPNALAATSSDRSIFVYSNEGIYVIEPPNTSCTLMKLDTKLPILRGASLSFYDHSLYLFGGKIRRNEYSNTLYVINTRNNEVKKYENMEDAPSPRWNHSAVVYHKDLIVYGGCYRQATGPVVLSDAAILDLKKLEWRPFDIELAPRKRHTMLMYGKFIVIVGGIENHTTIINLVTEDVFVCDDIGNYSTSFPYSHAAIFPEGDAFLVAGAKDKKFGFAAIFDLEMPPFVKQSHEKEHAMKAIAMSDDNMHNPSARSRKNNHKHQHKHKHASVNNPFRKHKKREPAVVIKEVPENFFRSDSIDVIQSIDSTDDDTSRFDESDQDIRTSLSLTENEPIVQPSTHPDSKDQTNEENKDDDSFDQKKDEDKSEKDEDKSEKDEDKSEKDEDKSEKDEDKSEKDEGKIEKDKGKSEKDKGKSEKDKGKSEKDRKRKKSAERGKSKHKHEEKDKKKKEASPLKKSPSHATIIDRYRRPSLTLTSPQRNLLDDEFHDNPATISPNSDQTTPTNNTTNTNTNEEDMTKGQNLAVEDSATSPLLDNSDEFIFEDDENIKQSPTKFKPVTNNEEGAAAEYSKLDEEVKMVTPVLQVYVEKKEKEDRRKKEKEERKKQEEERKKEKEERKKQEKLRKKQEKLNGKPLLQNGNEIMLMTAGTSMDTPLLQQYDSVQSVAEKKKCSKTCIGISVAVSVLVVVGVVVAVLFVLKH
ncbi:guanine nucleotide exchange factor [Tritrichomonas foetus]|uniref:Guanine nucleotide exchange factor n=1 Tax=Tritrichomonas foetus TaxID=1144522 RepID=A0A1J4KA09_9EUKA|nr:guanine nucleotide exchange factor [Tritrichomonas foetus]|eukprot:OHT06285.1 guanine nucleotide exchange factor [Tritrichomonas foetus]